MYRILEKHELVNVWPVKRNAYKCIVLNSDNTKSEVNIPIAECELIMYLNLIKHNLNQAEMESIKKLIEKFGEEKHDAGRQYENDCNNEDL